MPVQHNIDIGGRFLWRNMLQAKFQSASRQIDNQPPLRIRIAISPNECDFRTDRAQLIQDSFRADVAQMPDLIRLPRKIDNYLRQFVVRVGEDENFQTREPKPKPQGNCKPQAPKATDGRLP